MPLSPTSLSGWRFDLEEYAYNYNLQLALKDMIGLIVMPEFVTDKAHGRYRIMVTDQARRRHIVRHTSGAAFERITQEGSSAFYDVEDYGLEIPTDKKRRSEFKDSIEWQQEDATTLDMGCRLAHEMRVAATITDPAAFTLNNPTGPAWSFATRASMTPKRDIDVAYNAIRGTCGVPRSELSLTLTYERWCDLAACTELQALLKYVTTDIVLGGDAAKRKIFADYLEIKDIVVARSQYITSKPGAAARTFASVWPENTMFLAPLAPSDKVPLTYPCVGRTVRWTGEDGDLPSFLSMNTYKQIERDVDITRTRQFTDEFPAAINGETIYHIDASKTQE